MKKTLYAFSMLAFFLTFSLAVSAQTVTVANTTNCNLQVQAEGSNAFCGLVCGMLTQTSPAVSTVTFPMVCTSAAPPASYVVAISDPLSGSGVKVGNGCGAPGFGNIIDCQGSFRTVFFAPPSTVFVF